MLITALWCRGQGVVGKGNLKTILSLLGNSKGLKTHENFISEKVTVDLNKKGCGSPSLLFSRGGNTSPLERTKNRNRSS